MAFRLVRSVAAASSVALVLIAGSASAALASGEPIAAETDSALVQVVEEPVVEPVVEPSLPPAEADEPGDQPTDETEVEPPPSDTTSGGGPPSKHSAPAGSPNGPVPPHAAVAPAPPDAGTDAEPLTDGEAPAEPQAPPADTEIEPDVLVDPAPEGETGSGTESAVDSGSEPAPSPDLSPSGTVDEAPTEPLPAEPPAVDSAPLHDPLAEPVVTAGTAPADVTPQAGAAVMPHTSSASAGPGAADPAAAAG
ncbi:MAG TPA: hypothetical protein VFO78_11045, partial [Candidatus Limnocylindrales bacterium]|nr:hypothetical protein [Candidatus Limnocylindrales bacterium]